MKIKNQFRLFIAGILLVPIVCSIALPTYAYLSSPERILIKGYKELSKIQKLSIKDEDIQVLKNVIKDIPPNVQISVIAEHSLVLLSNIPEIKTNSMIDDTNLFSYMKQTSRNYFYQVMTPDLSNNTSVLIITRAPKEHETRRQRKSNFITHLFFFFLIFESFCIVFIVLISQTISRSISILEKDTEKIASGDLDFKIDNPTKHRTINEITSLSKNLDKMRQALKEETERRTRFIMGISHDLRTPVALIKGYTEALYDGVGSKPEAVKKSLEVIGNKTNQLETMIDTLINCMKLDSTQWRNQLVPQDIAPVIKEFITGAITTCDVYKRKAISEISIKENTKILFDKMLFNRVLENLFSNALRYTNENDEIRLKAIQNDSEIKIEISDTGIGIEQDELAHIFDMFYRGTNSRREGGMGIGLSVVKNIIDTHGWSINVKSEKAKGTCFTITIPLTNTKEKT